MPREAEKNNTHRAEPEEEEEKEKRREGKGEKEKTQHVGVLFDIAAAHLGDGNDNLALLRGAGRASLRDPHRRIRLVLLPLHYHPRPRRHLDHNYPTL